MSADLLCRLKFFVALPLLYASHVHASASQYTFCTQNAAELAHAQQIVEHLNTELGEVIHFSAVNAGSFSGMIEQFQTGKCHLAEMDGVQAFGSIHSPSTKVAALAIEDSGSYSTIWQ